MHPSTNTSAPATEARPRGNGVADLVRWGPVVSGVVVGLGVFALFDVLWLAIADGNGNGWIYDNLGWFVGGTAIAALLVAGFVAGLLAGVRGAGAGLANGVTAWGLLVVLTMVGGIPGMLGLGGSLDLGWSTDRVLWTTFWSLLIGLGAAGLGGLLGGVLRRPVVTPAMRDAEPRQNRDEPRPTVMTDNHAVDETRPAPVVRDEETQTVGSSRL